MEKLERLYGEFRVRYMQFLAAEPPSEDTSPEHRKALKNKKTLQVVANGATAPAASDPIAPAKTSTAAKGNATKPKIPVFEDGQSETGLVTPVAGEWVHGLPSQESKARENTQAPAAWNGALPSKATPMTGRPKVSVYIDQQPQASETETEPSVPAPAQPTR